MVKRQYVTPQAEKVEFNYLETVVASGNLKAGANRNGCYKGSNASKSKCRPK